MDGLRIEDSIRAKRSKPVVENPKKKTKLRNLDHHFLAVVLEDVRPTAIDKTASQFCIYTLDSSPEKFKANKVQQLFYDKIHKKATKMGSLPTATMQSDRMNQ